MPVEFHAATPIEVYTFTAWDLFKFIAAWFGTALLAAGFGAWVFWSGTPEPTPPAVEVDAPESVKTDEIPRRSGPRTGTIHAPQYQRNGADDTVVIKPAETRR